jgi:hypothetical protein
MGNPERDDDEPRRPLAPLVRLGGQWWYRDQIVAAPGEVDAPTAIGDLDPPMRRSD